ncbi:hypothetical protein [Pantoea sp. BAV 3049]|uniref:hypothetical protein n=1 Tax=Pantoea sp. BAV 3049 TaxID=2654188 RepID=UPI00131CF40E|nr:hypothetical protein [Pantoea sp. BAV 3049]
MKNNFYFENKKEKHLLVIIAIAILGLWFWYMLWASGIGRRTVLMKTIPELTTYITVGSIIGLFFAGHTTYYRPVGRTPIYVLKSFGGGFCIGLVSILNFYDVCVYLVPGEINQYKSEYEITFPGPSTGKSSHCEAGLWIKDAHTQRWIQLCTNRTELYQKQSPGMNKVRVTARSNNLGSYILDYQFIYK